MDVRVSTSTGEPTTSKPAGTGAGSKPARGGGIEAHAAHHRGRQGVAPIHVRVAVRRGKRRARGARRDDSRTRRRRTGDDGRVGHRRGDRRRTSARHGVGSKTREPRVVSPRVRGDDARRDGDRVDPSAPPPAPATARLAAAAARAVAEGREPPKRERRDRVCASRADSPADVDERSRRGSPVIPPPRRRARRRSSPRTLPCRAPRGERSPGSSNRTRTTPTYSQPPDASGIARCARAW